MRSRVRPTLVAALVLAVLASAITASAAGLGGLASGLLSGARAETRHHTGIDLTWTPAASGSSWRAEAVTLTTNPGESFRSGDRVTLTIQRHDSTACELGATTSAGDTIHFDRTAFAAACRTVAFDEIDSIAVAVAGDDPATTLTSDLGEVHGTLSAFGGSVIDPDRSLRTRIGTGRIGGISYLNALSVEVEGAGLSAADLAGARVIARLFSTDTSTAYEYSGAVSLTSSEPIHVDSTTTGATVITFTIDPIRLSDVNRVGIVLASPQHLGAGGTGGTASRYAISTVTDSLTGSGGSDDDETPAPPVSSALQAISLDQRLSYSYQEPTNFDANALGFCHTFTVSNTSSEPVDWTLTFDTSLPPLWGFDPTAAGAFSSAWNWETVSYDPATHRWTIRGKDGMRIVQPGATINGMGYCVADVPVPPVDPASFSSAVTVSASSNAYWVQLSLSVSSSSHWNRPWEVTVDLADHVCGAGLQDAALQWHASVEVTRLDATRYTVRGRLGANTRFVSASRPISLSPLLGYAPAGGKYRLPCDVTARTAGSGSAALPETAITEPIPSEAESTGPAVEPVSEPIDSSPAVDR